MTTLDLRTDGCTRIGAPTDVVQARSHAVGRAFGKTIHGEHADIDGLVYASRLTGEDVYAIYDRSVVKLNEVDVGRLEEHVELLGVLERHGIGLLLWRRGVGSVWRGSSAAATWRQTVKGSRRVTDVDLDPALDPTKHIRLVAFRKGSCNSA